MHRHNEAALSGAEQGGKFEGVMKATGEQTVHQNNKFIIDG
jgi:hypothetical protein